MQCFSKDNLVKDSVLEENSEVFQVLNQERKRCLYTSALCGSGVEFLTTAPLFYLMILLAYHSANLVSTPMPMIWQKHWLLEVLTMLLCQTDYQNNYSQLVFTFKFATFVAHRRKVCCKCKSFSVFFPL